MAPLPAGPPRASAKPLTQEPQTPPGSCPTPAASCLVGASRRSVSGWKLESMAVSSKAEQSSQPSQSD